MTQQIRKTIRRELRLYMSNVDLFGGDHSGSNDNATELGFRIYKHVIYKHKVNGIHLS
jgi:hypothetical protein